jgi:DNA-directed RNA polymerase specialized sigma subunit
MVTSFFPSERQVIRCLLTYTDWWQVPTASILQVAARRGDESRDGFRSGLLESLDERAELCRRVWLLEERDRRVLFLWYVQQLPVEEIARSVGISRRHCFRRRAKAVRAIVDPQDEAA